MSHDDENMAEFQRRMREFHPQWRRNFLTWFLPGFVAKDSM